MGHVLFLILHLIAAFFFFAALIVTIPLHLIYAAVSGRGESGPNPDTHVRCPSCQEFVHMDANICKHCRQKLVPYFEQRRQAQAAKAAARAKMSRLERFIRM